MKLQFPQLTSQRIMSPLVAGCSLLLLSANVTLAQDEAPTNRSILVDESGTPDSEPAGQQTNGQEQRVIEPATAGVVEELPAPEGTANQRPIPQTRPTPETQQKPVTRPAPNSRSPLPPTEGAQQRAGSNESLRALADASLRLNEQLEQFPTGAGWQQHLAMPAELFDEFPAETITQESLSSAYVRFEKVSRNPEYRMIAQLPAFEETQYRLAAHLGISPPPSYAQQAPGGVVFGRNAEVQFGGGQGARFGGANGVQFGGGQGARFGPNVQFGGGQGVRIGRFYIGR